MKFIYRDSAGNKTLRSLSNIKEDDLYIYAYCEYSKGLRTFRKDRIVQYIDASDSENYSHISLPSKGQERKSLSEDYALEICFTGFKALERTALESLAEVNNMKVRKSIVSRLDFLCIGDKPGKKKLKDAEDKGCVILTLDQYKDLIDHGLLPEGYKEKAKGVVWTEITISEIELLFSSYAFSIKKAHWPALGVQWKKEYFIDQEKTKILRELWEKEHPRYTELYPFFFRKKLSLVEDHVDYEEWVSLKKEREEKVVRYSAYAISDPPLHDFHEGDVFHSATSIIQVINDYDPVEVKLIEDGKSIGYHLTDKALEMWLKTGEKASDSFRIVKNQSKSAIAQYHEYSE